jgi:hypothetical protein
LTASPLFTLPKSYIGVANCIFGPEGPTAEATAAVAESNAGAGAEVAKGAEFVTLPEAISAFRPPLLLLTAYNIAATTTTAPPIKSVRPFVPPFAICTGAAGCSSRGA